MFGESTLKAASTRLSSDPCELEARAQESTYNAQYVQNSNVAMPVATYGSPGFNMPLGADMFGHYTPRSRVGLNIDSDFYFTPNLELDRERVEHLNDVKFPGPIEQRASDCMDVSHYSVNPELDIHLWRGDCAEETTNAPRSSRADRRNKC